MSVTIAEACTDTLLFHQVSQFRVPHNMTSNRGAQITSTLWNCLVSTFGVDLHQTSYHAQSSRVVKQTLQ